MIERLQVPVVAFVQIIGSFNCVLAKEITFEMSLKGQTEFTQPKLKRSATDLFFLIA